MDRNRSWLTEVEWLESAADAAVWDGDLDQAQELYEAAETIRGEVAHVAGHITGLRIGCEGSLVAA